MSKLLSAWNDLQQRVQSIAELGQARVVKCSDPGNLLSQMQAVPSPFCGVVYEGMRASGDKQGLGTTAVFGLYIAVDTNNIVPSLDRAAETAALLELIRKALLTEISPAGHKWVFVVESFADTIKGKAVWVQRWQTAVINEKA